MIRGEAGTDVVENPTVRLKPSSTGTKSPIQRGEPATGAPSTRSGPQSNAPSPTWKDWKSFATRYGGPVARLGSSVAQCLGPGQGERRGAVLPAVLREGEVARKLPLLLGQRLWYLVPVTAIWIAGALLRYWRRRAGVQLNVRSLIRRRRWHSAGPGGLGHAVRTADRPNSLGGKDVAADTVLGRARADVCDDLVRPEEDPVRNGPSPKGEENSGPLAPMLDSQEARSSSVTPLAATTEVRRDSPAHRLALWLLVLRFCL